MRPHATGETVIIEETPESAAANYRTTSSHNRPN
ncbi:hypothetical protein BH24CHL4_BH24CHL4_13790 [soil metagenome]